MIIHMSIGLLSADAAFSSCLKKSLFGDPWLCLVVIVLWACQVVHQLQH
jgi:hypothetical protein